MANILSDIFSGSLQKKPLLFDGALGTYLLKNNAGFDKCLWTSHTALDNPSLLEKVHREYIESGADIITSNTFRSNPAAADNSKYSSELLVKRNFEVLKNCLPSKDKLMIAGSNAPAEDCYQAERNISRRELEYNHHKHISLLMENGANFILNETQSHFDEIKIICSYCYKENIPFGLSIYFKQYDKILSGENLSDIINFITDNNPLFISFNCTGFGVLSKLLSAYTLAYNWGFYLNCGKSNPETGIIDKIISPKEYIDLCRPFFDKSPVIVGSCCGSTPEHTKFLREFIDERYKN
jgi:methionine synthase I (cobalamin-dependent)